MGRRQAAHASRWTSDRPMVSPEGRIFGRFGPVGGNSDPPTLAARATARFESRRSAEREGGPAYARCASYGAVRVSPERGARRRTRLRSLRELRRGSSLAEARSAKAIPLHLRMTRGGDCFVGLPPRNDKEDVRLFT